MHRRNESAAYISLLQEDNLSSFDTHIHRAPTTYVHSSIRNLHYTLRAWMKNFYRYNPDYFENILGKLFYQNRRNLRGKYLLILPIVVLQINKALFPCRASTLLTPSNQDARRRG